MAPDTPNLSRIRNAARGCYVGFAAFALGRALAYSPLLDTDVQEPPPEAIQLLTQLVPLLVWSAAWFAAFLVTAVGMFRPRSWCLIPTLVMVTVWGAAYIMSWTLGESANGWLTSLLFLPLLPVFIAGTTIAGQAVRWGADLDRVERKNREASR